LPTRTNTVAWDVVTIPRVEFARSYFWYEPGEHVVFAGPTGTGKTQLCFVLLEYTATPECPAYVIVSKPRDAVTEREGKRLGYRFTDRWPVERKVSEAWDGPPSGYIIWPRFGDIDKDIPRAAAVSRAVLSDRYTQGVRGKKGILVCDDTVVKSKIFGLDREMTTHLAMAKAMSVGSWYFVQKPTDAGKTALWSYGNSEHIFVARDPDRRNRVRYDEIGGVDPYQVEAITETLSEHQFLYMKRGRVNGQQIMCIVDK
jgi:energy-coupling factor transporter ATP-binding protein EcfA2